MPLTTTRLRSSPTPSRPPCFPFRSIRAADRLVARLLIRVLPPIPESKMADDEQIAELKKKRTFKKFTYRGVDLDQLLDMNT